jgi:hypothetical protein
VNWEIVSELQKKNANRNIVGDIHMWMHLFLFITFTEPHKTEKEIQEAYPVFYNMIRAFKHNRITDFCFSRTKKGISFCKVSCMFFTN